MDEYIERAKAFKLIKEQKEKETGAYSKGRNIGLIIAGSIINNKEQLPTADVVEVRQIEIIRDDLKWWLETNTEKGVVYIPEFVVKNMIKKMTRTPKERGGEK